MADYYQSEGDREPAEPAAEESSDNLQETALVPKSALGSKEIEVGKECKFKIVSIHEDEVEIEYVPHKDKDDEKEPDPDDTHAKIDADVAKMGMAM